MKSNCVDSSKKILHTLRAELSWSLKIKDHQQENKTDCLIEQMNRVIL